MEGKNNTAIIVGVSVVGVLAIVITIIAVKSKSNKNDETITALTSAGLIRNPANNTTIVQTDKAALYTGAASVINNVLDTFFSGNNNNNNNSSNSSTKLTNDEWDKEYGDIFY